ncbi:TonB-dependent receptor [Pseudemcibacter aquimaris]|uniref:TonB-dependent receptor n=1 Tax=Pseudemcibacter aquimaris TaxID=2857064 RepID=UPI002011CFC0|nr:TonB-dependent receptor [Pseudemcibacter aquimaris]MCC3861529.1 TonB-dependent receptor [Pseudemcibacter aquimaris]WDU58298.1 TonB-dependent receptor [Pseudemcibacter aquimaris]
MNVKNIALLGVSVFAFSPIFSQAQETSDAQVNEDVVTVTATRSTKIASDVVGNQASVSGSEISFIAPTHINEALQGIAGANISRNNGQESLISLRSPIFTGAGACGAFLTAMDGIPLRGAGFCNVNELFDAFPEQGGRVEVVRGPGSVLYGSNAMHGIVNVVSRPVGDAESEASFEGGSWGYFRGTGSVAFKEGNHGVRVSGMAARDGGYIEESGFNQQKGHFRHEFDNGELSISTNFQFTNLDQETAGYLEEPDDWTELGIYKDPVAAKTNGNPEAYRKAKSFRYWSTISTEIADNVRFQISPYARTMDMEFLMHFLPGQPLEENKQTSFGFQNGFYINEGGQFEVIAGIDAEIGKGELVQTQENPPTQGFLVTRLPVGKNYDYEVDTKMIAGFVRGDFDVTDQLTLVGGIRAEHMAYDYDNRMVSGQVDENGDACAHSDGCRYTRPEDREDKFDNVSFEAGMLFKIDETNRFFARYSRGFRAPQSTELYRLQRGQLVADIDSVKLDSIEVGIRGNADTYSYEVAGFYMKKDNVIFQDNRINVDNGASKHIGVEGMFEYRFPQDVSVRFNGSYAEHTYDFDYMTGDINWNGLDIDTAPRNFGSIQLNWAPADKVKAGLEWIYMGEYYMEPTNTIKYEGHNYLNFRIEAEAMEGVDIFMRVMNLTNVRYAERADVSFGTPRYFVGRPRAFFGGARVRF